MIMIMMTTKVVDHDDDDPDIDYEKFSSRRSREVRNGLTFFNLL